MLNLVEILLYQANNVIDLFESQLVEHWHTDKAVGIHVAIWQIRNLCIIRSVILALVQAKIMEHA